MTDQVVSVLPCPFCGTGAPAVAVRLRAARGIVSKKLWLCADGSSHPAVAFGAVGGPCPHLISLGVWVSWVRPLRGDDGPRGHFGANWCHAATTGVRLHQLEQLWAAGRGTGALRRPPATPFRVVDGRCEGVVTGRPAPRTWRWSVEGHALFAADPEELCNELLRSARPRRPYYPKEFPW